MQSLGIDLSTKVCGIAVISPKRLHDPGVPYDRHTPFLKTSYIVEPEGDFWERQNEVLNHVLKTIETYRPNVVVFEAIRLFHQGKINIHSIIELARLSGTIGYVAKRFGVEVIEVHTSTWRKAVLGSGKADKDAVVQWVKDRNISLSSNKPDEAEAIALALYGLIAYSNGLVNQNLDTKMKHAVNTEKKKKATRKR